MSLQEAGDEIGVSASALCRFENSISKPDMLSMVAIANWLKMPLSANAIVVYPANMLEAITDIIKADDNVADKDGLCKLFEVCYRGMAGRSAGGV
jgi:transcriptional regulator with XRE-family HTH domain